MSRPEADRDGAADLSRLLDVLTAVRNGSLNADTAVAELLSAPEASLRALAGYVAGYRELPDTHAIEGEG